MENVEDDIDLDYIHSLPKNGHPHIHKRYTT
jgi:hypothetical protein